MDIAIIVLPAVAYLLVSVLVICCCITAGRADERIEEMRTGGNDVKD